ncbi:hypothetical protein ID866_1974 [Astraeus odoratus]|nr:hypothetical protein ID866_1974 [Astraeus odoratus]
MYPPLATTMMLAMPPSPVEFVCPVTAPDGSISYDRPLDNFFDLAMADKLLSAQAPAKLYDAIANAHDTRFQLRHEMFSEKDPVDWSKCPSGVGRERLRQVALLRGDSPNYLGISGEHPGWRPRRSSYEDIRGAVPVTLAEVNSLPPSIEPEETSMTASANVTEVLQDEARQPALFGQSMGPTERQGYASDADDEMDWGYGTDSTVAARVPVVTSIPSQTSSKSRSSSDSESDDDTDTETDADSDDYHNRSLPPISEASPMGVPQWIVPRKCPSFVIIDVGDNHETHPAPGGPDSSSSCTESVSSFSDVRPRQVIKRKSRKLAAPSRTAKKPRRTEEDTAVDTGGQGPLVAPITDLPRDVSVPPIESIPDPGSSIRPTSTSVSEEPSRASVPTCTQTNRSKPLKQGTKQAFPCLLDGCMQVCYSAGDLIRHQQSLRHRAPEFVCLGCKHAFTRPDALKRHLNSKPKCKGGHKAAAADQETRA